MCLLFCVNWVCFWLTMCLLLSLPPSSQATHTQTQQTETQTRTTTNKPNTSNKNRQTENTQQEHVFSLCVLVDLVLLFLFLVGFRLWRSLSPSPQTTHTNPNNGKTNEQTTTTYKTNKDPPLKKNENTQQKHVCLDCFALSLCFVLLFVIWVVVFFRLLLFCFSPSFSSCELFCGVFSFTITPDNPHTNTHTKNTNKHKLNKPRTHNKTMCLCLACFFGFIMLWCFSSTIIPSNPHKHQNHTQQANNNNNNKKNATTPRTHNKKTCFCYFLLLDD